MRKNGAKTRMSLGRIVKSSGETFLVEGTEPADGKGEVQLQFERDGLWFRKFSFLGDSGATVCNAEGKALGIISRLAGIDQQSFVYRIDVVLPDLHKAIKQDTEDKKEKTGL